MLTTRKADDRGLADHGWLKSHFTFSFADYHDPRFMGFGPLRVLNDDTIAPGAGFPPHPHRDMEIITYVLDGGVAHQDSMGTGAVVRAGEVQVMRAGTGVVHSELNASDEEKLRLLQIWIVPDRRGMKPGYQQRAFSDEEKRGKLALVVSPDGADGSLQIAANVRLYASILAAGDRVTHTLAAGHRAWLQVARGAVTLNGQALAMGDGLAITDTKDLVIEGDGEVLLFDLGA